MNVRPYLEEDLKKMMALEEANFPENMRWKEEDFRNRENFVALDGAQIVGFISYREKEEEISISNLLVEGSYRKRGVGQSLLDSLFTAFKDRKFVLHVLTTNEPAINLYRKNGFSIVETELDYYDPGEDAHYMVK